MFGIEEIDDAIARCAPENLIACRSEDLLEIAHDGYRYSDEVRIPCIAELFVRRTVFQSQSVEDAVIDALLANGERCEFLSRMSPLRINSYGEADRVGWTPESEFSKRCLRAVKSKCRLVYGADGFVPVCDTATREAMFIPFRFEAPSGEDLVVRDIANQVSENWTDCWRELASDSPANEHYDVILSCSLEYFGTQTVGRSLMLPLLLAWKRKCGQLPRYDILRLLATGAIADGSLAAVEVEEKLDVARREMPTAYFVYPGMGTETVPRQEVRRPIGERTSDTIATVDKSVVEKGLANLDYRSAYCRLVAMEAEVRGCAFGGWGAIVGRLSHLLEAIPEFRDGENHLLGLMLLSAAYCHAGDTAAALQANRRAQEYARSHGFEDQELRLEVEKLVCLQDVEAFADVIRLSEDLGSRIEEFGNADLQMRYYGTMGQAFAYSALTGLDSITNREKSLECFRRAVEFAYKLFDDAQQLSFWDANVLSRAGNVAQDLNYMCLWHALFDGANLSDFDAVRDVALQHLQGECARIPGSEGVVAKNDAFLRRITALASYRVLLHGADAKDLLSNSRLRQQPDNARPSWITATSDKYIAAIKAAAGHVAEAEALFQRAWDAVAESRDQIIAYIRFTVACEAVRSFRAVGRDDLVGRWLSRADEQWNSQSFSAFASARGFRDFLDGDGMFPGLKYWY